MATVFGVNLLPGNVFVNLSIMALFDVPGKEKKNIRQYSDTFHTTKSNFLLHKSEIEERTAEHFYFF